MTLCNIEKLFLQRPATLLQHRKPTLYLRCATQKIRHGILYLFQSRIIVTSTMIHNSPSRKIKGYAPGCDVEMWGNVSNLLFYAENWFLIKCTSVVIIHYLKLTFVVIFHNLTGGPCIGYPPVAKPYLILPHSREPHEHQKLNSQPHYHKGFFVLQKTKNIFFTLPLYLMLYHFRFQQPLYLIQYHFRFQHFGPACLICYLIAWKKTVAFNFLCQNLSNSSFTLYNAICFIQY